MVGMIMEHRLARWSGGVGVRARTWALATLLLALWGAGAIGSGGVSAQEATPAASPTAFTPTEVVVRVAPAVVTVNNLQVLRGFGSDGTAQRAGTGTGFVLNDQGYIVTNEHVVRGGDEFVVVFRDGEERPAALIGTDPLADLAVVKVEGAVPATVSLGNSDALQVAEPVLAIGSPLGEFTNTVTAGIVSALNRDFPLTSVCAGVYTNLIQHDAAINPGNSGGPLFNAAGEVIGVNTLGISTAQGLFFAVPASTVEQITTEIIEDGEVSYPFFGVVSQPVTDEVAAGADLMVDYGQYVVSAEAGQPAAEAGIQEGDVLLTVDGQRIDEQNSFTELLFALEPGDTVEVTVQRGGEEVTTQVTLGTREELLPEECFAEEIVP